MSERHVHDCTGPDARCHCGYVFTVPPVSVHLEVDNGRASLINDGFNCDDVETVAHWLREMADKLEEAQP